MSATTLLLPTEWVPDTADPHPPPPLCRIHRQQRHLQRFEDRAHLAHDAPRDGRDDAALHAAGRTIRAAVEVLCQPSRLLDHQRAGGVVPGLGTAIEVEM